MLLTTLGSTGRTVSRIGLGLAALGRPGYINLGHAVDLGADRSVEAMERRAHAVLDAAWQAGVRYVDAARSYGRAEAFLASWLAGRSIPRDALTIGTKWGYVYTAGWAVDARVHEAKSLSIENLLRQSVESNRLLGDRIDVYQIHSATLDSGVLDDPDVLRELSRLRANGWAIGLSVSGPDQRAAIERALEVRVDGVALFQTVQATWNLLERAAAPALEAAHRAGWGVIIKEAMANGRLAGRVEHAESAAAREALERQARRLGTTPDALAIAAVVARPWAHTVLSGASTIDQLASNLGALAVAWDDEAEQSLGGLAETPEMYWSIRSRLPWN